MKHNCIVQCLMYMILFLLVSCTTTQKLNNSPVRSPIPQLQKTYADFRAQQVSKVSYTLSVKLGEIEDFFEGQVDMAFYLAEGNKAPVTIDFHSGVIKKILVNGSEVKWDYNKYYITLLPAVFEAGHENTVVIQYQRDYETSGVGLHRYKDVATGNAYVYTTFEPYHANKFFPHFDQPNIKAQYTLDVIAPTSWTVISATRETTIQKTEEYQHWFFPPTKRISSYIFPLHAGPFYVWEDEYKGDFGVIPLRLFARQELAKYVVTEDWFNFTRQSFEFFNDYFGSPYPFGKYDQVIAPDFRWGAMENLAAVTFNEGFVKRSKKVEQERRKLAITISHEMAHMWFGNLVTMEWWNGLWLNESFATYMSYLQVEKSGSFDRIWDNFYSRMKDWAYWQDQLVTTHPIELPVVNTDDAMSNFDGITYGKGASVLKQLPFFVGDHQFRDGVRAYMKEHAYGNAELRHLTGAIEQASNIHLGQWTKKWLRTAGLNTIEAKFECNNGALKELQLIQTAPKGYPTLREQKLNVGLFHVPELGGSAHSILEIPIVYSGASTNVPIPKGTQCPSFIFPNLGDWAYVKVRLDPKSRELLMRKIHSFEDDSLRLMLWQSMWDSVSDVKMSIVDYVQFVVDNFPQEQGARIVAQVSRQIGFTHRFLWDIDKTGTDMAVYRGTLSELVWKQLTLASSGSDRQKMMFDLWVSIANRQEDFEFIHQFLVGDVSLPQFVVDQDRRWNMLMKLNEFAYKDSQNLGVIEGQKDMSDRGSRMKIAVQAVRPEEGIKLHWLETISREKNGYKLSELSSVMSHLFPPSQGKIRRKLLGAIHKNLIQLKSHSVAGIASNFAGLVPLEACDLESVTGITQLIKANPDFSPVIYKRLLVRRQESGVCMGIERLARMKLH